MGATVAVAVGTGVRAAVGVGCVAKSPLQAAAIAIRAMAASKIASLSLAVRVTVILPWRESVPGPHRKAGDEDRLVKILTSAKFVVSVA